VIGGAFRYHERGYYSLEDELGSRLPAGYREFCELFGPGEFDGHLRIFGPCSSFPHWMSEEETSELASLKGELESEMELSVIPGYATSVNFQLIARLIERGFVFGSTPDTDVLLWTWIAITKLMGVVISI